MRMFFISALVIAFAFPYNKHDNVIDNSADNLIAIYIDNSMSMQSHSAEKTLFEDSRTSALKLVENLNQAQKIGIRKIANVMLKCRDMDFAIKNGTAEKWFAVEAIIAEALL